MNNGPTVKRESHASNCLISKRISVRCGHEHRDRHPNRIYMASGNATGGGRTALPHLTRRQLEVLALLCEGLPNKLICRELDISAGTVKAHISSILRELGVGSRLQAVVEARRRGLLGANGEGPRQLHSAGQGQAGGPVSISFGPRATANRSSHGRPGE